MSALGATLSISTPRRPHKQRREAAPIRFEPGYTERDGTDMATLNQIRVVWNGLPGGTGISTFYADPTGTPPTAYINSFFNNFKTICPSLLSWVIPNGGNEIDIASGQPVGHWTQGSVATIAATGTGAFAWPTGAMVRWDTNSWLGGRRLSGKTFLVPLLSSCYDTDGTLSAGTVTNIANSAATLVSGAPGLRVWSRRSAAAASIASSTCVDKAVVMRSRRD